MASDFLFDMDELQVWLNEWQGMPEFIQEDLTPWRTLPVHFENREQLRRFADLVGQKITPRTKCIWYPVATIGHYANKRYIDES